MIDYSDHPLFDEIKCIRCENADIKYSIDYESVKNGYVYYCENCNSKLKFLTQLELKKYHDLQRLKKPPSNNFISNSLVRNMFNRNIPVPPEMVDLEIIDLLRKIGWRIEQDNQGFWLGELSINDNHKPPKTYIQGNLFE